MKIIAPDYYKDFKCIAGACKHSCCRGWEIDIDEDSLKKYKDMPEIYKHINTDDVPHFELDGSNCPCVMRYRTTEETDTKLKTLRVAKPLSFVLALTKSKP